MKCFKFGKGKWRYGEYISLQMLELQLLLGIHAEERSVERLKELGVNCNKDEGYLEVTIDIATQAIQHKLLNKYLYNLNRQCKRTNKTEQVVIHMDSPVITFVLEVRADSIYVVTLYSKYNTNHNDDVIINSVQRECWLYDTALKFTTKEGMTTWTLLE